MPGPGVWGLEAASQELFGGAQVGANGGAADAEGLGRSLGIGAGFDPGSQSLVNGAVRAGLQGLEEGVGSGDGRFGGQQAVHRRRRQMLGYGVIVGWREVGDRQGQGEFGAASEVLQVEAEGVLGTRQVGGDGVAADVEQPGDTGAGEVQGEAGDVEGEPGASLIGSRKAWAQARACRRGSSPASGGQAW